MYFDDVICFGCSFDQHPRDLCEVLLCLLATSLNVKLSNSNFASICISFLDYILLPDFFHTNPFPISTCVKRMRFSLDLSVCYPKFNL